LDIRIGLSVVGPYVLGGLAVVLVGVGLVFLLRTRIGAWLAALSPESDVAGSVARLAIVVVLAIVLLLAFSEILASLGFFVGLGITMLDFILAAIVSAAATHFAARRLFPTQAAVATGVVLATVATLLLLALLLSAWFYDASDDGNTTHQVATVQLANGWNPVTTPSVDKRIGQWSAVEHYSKGAWIRDAVVYRVTGRLEQAKSSNLLLILAAFAVWLALLLTIAPKRPNTAVFGSLLAALNPISLQQSFVFMVDGQLSSLIVLTVGLGGLVFTQLGEWPVLLALAAVIAMLVTVKFTGLVFAVVLLAGLALAVVLRRRTVRWRVVLGCLAAALVFGTFVTGFSPYVVNTLQHGSPFYPLFGPGSVDIMSNNEPSNFVHGNSLQRLGLSLFSRSLDVSPVTVGSTVSHLKVPFSLDRSEIRPYLSFVTQVAGFGPWFGGALLIAALLTVLLLGNRMSRSDPLVLWAFFAGAVVAVSALINPQAWWARYSPQLWLVPVIVGLAGVYRGPSKWHRAMGWALCVVLLLDSAFVGFVSFANVAHARREISTVLDTAASWPDGVVLRQGIYEESWIKLQERGIRYRIVSDDTTMTGGLPIPYTTAIIRRAP